MGKVMEMLNGINPLLTGDLLKYLDEAGHSDGIVVVDAHFPAARLATRVVPLPGVLAPVVLAAICSVLPLDDEHALDLMASATGAILDVQRELMVAAKVDEVAARFTERFDFYEDARRAAVIIRTGETRKYGCAIVRKGLARKV